jgi:hypothetical protein
VLVLRLNQGVCHVSLGQELVKQLPRTVQVFHLYQDHVDYGLVLSVLLGDLPLGRLEESVTQQALQNG